LGTGTVVKRVLNGARLFHIIDNQNIILLTGVAPVRSVLVPEKSAAGTGIETRILKI